MIIAGQERRDEAPPAGMRRIAMHQKDTGLRSIAPAQIVDARTLHSDETLFRHLSDCIAEPAWTRRRRTRQRRELALIGLKIEQTFTRFLRNTRNRRRDRRIRHQGFQSFPRVQPFLSIAPTVPRKDSLKRAIYLKPPQCATVGIKASVWD